HEGVVWFHDKGSAVATFAVQIGAATASETTAETITDVDDPPLDTPTLSRPNVDAADPGAFPMFGVPLNSVIGLLGERGATLLHLENDRSCGADWVSYRYFVRK